MPGPNLKREENRKRETYPIRANADGIDRMIDPDGDIYSGMTKRLARTNGGIFTREEFREIKNEG
jgi:hypothetical protein